MSATTTSPTTNEPSDATADEARRPLPSTMRAVVRRAWGEPSEVVETVEVPVPDPGPGEVLVEVAAAGIDRGTWHLVTGRPYAVRLAGYGVRRPKEAGLGLDVAGVVVALGEGVDGFAVGDRVAGVAAASYADYTTVPVGKLSHVPDGVDLLDAAVVPISGGTAVQAVVDAGRVRAGQRVLVLGASGGVGSYAAQVAIAAGAEVVGTASTHKLDAVRGLGVAAVVDHRREDPLAEADAYDLIVDTGGLRSLRELRRALKGDGTLVIVGGEGGGSITGGAGRGIRAMLWSPFVSQRMTTLLPASEAAEHAERVLAMVAAGDVEPLVDRVVGLDEVAAAVDALVRGEVAGKVVVRVR